MLRAARLGCDIAAVTITGGEGMFELLGPDANHLPKIEELPEMIVFVNSRGQS